MGVIVIPSMRIVRRGPQTFEYGNQYNDTAVIFRTGSAAFIKAWSGKAPTVKEWRKMSLELKQFGITHVAWERRHKDGSVHRVLRKL